MQCSLSLIKIVTQNKRGIINSCPLNKKKEFSPLGLIDNNNC